MDLDEIKKRIKTVEDLFQKNERVQQDALRQALFLQGQYAALKDLEASWEKSEELAPEVACRS